MRELLSKVWKKEEGFSLIELIIVIAILAIIAAIAVPNLIDNIDRSNKTTDTSNAKMIADSISTAIAQNPGYAGTAVAKVSFDGTPAAGTILGDAEVVLNGVVPKVKSASNGTVGGFFQVQVTTSGAITVWGQNGTSQLFPVQ